jgi:hypothetical protein
MLFPLTVIGWLFFVISRAVTGRCGVPGAGAGFGDPACTYTCANENARNTARAFRAFLLLVSIAFVSSVSRFF